MPNSPSLSALQELTESAHIPAVSYAYIEPNAESKGEFVSSVLAFGKKNVESAESDVNVETLFPAASLSKIVFAYLVLQLVGQKKISLDEPLHPILNYERFMIEGKYPKKAKQLTARHVLSHTTGLPNLGPNLSSSLAFDPSSELGEKYSYSGEAFIYLQKVIEKKMGKNLEELAKEYVFKPLKMKYSTFLPKPKNDSNIVAVHTRLGKPTSIDETLQGLLRLNAAGSLLTTAEDFSKFLVAWLENMNDPLFQQAFEPKSTETQEFGTCGLGWHLYRSKDKGELIAYQYGENKNMLSFVAINVNAKKAAVFFANSENGKSIANQILTSPDLAPIGNLQAVFEHLDSPSNEPGWKEQLAGELAEEQGRFEDAKRSFQEALNCSPKDKTKQRRSQYQDQFRLFKIHTLIQDKQSIASLMKAAHIPGIAIGIISARGEITTESVGVTQAKNPSEVRDSTVFEAASLSKPVFGYLVLKLAQENIIDLDTPLHKYCDFGPPSMREHINYKKLTARLILSHQAGLPNEFNPPTIPFDYVSPTSKTFDYSGEAYRFLGEVVEKVTSKSLETLAQEVFTKIGMTHSSFMPPTGCNLIRLRDEQELTSELVKELLESESNKQGQLSIIYHKDKLFVAERAYDGSIQITEKKSSQVGESAFLQMKERFASIPPFIWSQPILIEARELPLVTLIVGHPPKNAATIAIGHFQDGSENPNKRFYGVHPAGSLYTTASDYALFLRACIDDPEISEELFKPALSSLKDKDTKAIAKDVAPEVLEQLAWGLGIGLQKNADGSRVAFHWGDNGTGRNLAAIKLSTGEAIVCLTNSANGPAVFRAIAEPVVGDLSPISQWLSKREGLPVHPVQGIKPQLQEQKLTSTKENTSIDAVKEHSPSTLKQEKTKARDSHYMQHTKSSKAKEREKYSPLPTTPKPWK